MINRIFLEKYPLRFLQVVGWACYALTDHIAHIMYGSNHLYATIASAFVALLLTTALVLLDDLLKIKLTLIRGLTFLLALFVISVLWRNCFALLHGHIKLSELSGYSIQNLLSGVSSAFYLFVAWTGLMLGSKYFLSNRTQQQALSDALLQKKQAQLETLRYQLNPHFLFNTLNSIDVSILSGDVTTSHNMLSHLSDFLRNSLNNQDKDNILLHQEMAVMQDFITIEKLRFGDRVNVCINIDNACQSALLPPMILLPLVENAIKFAWSSSDKGQITISASKSDNQLSIIVLNNKVNNVTNKIGTGTGLKNIKKRLAVAYGEDASIHIHDSQTDYRINLLLPWITRFSDG